MIKTGIVMLALASLIVPAAHAQRTKPGGYSPPTDPPRSPATPTPKSKQYYREADKWRRMKTHEPAHDALGREKRTKPGSITERSGTKPSCTTGTHDVCRQKLSPK